MLFYRRLNGLAFFFATLLIDLEPVIYLLFGVPFPQIQLLFGGFARQGYHMITHNPFSIIVLVAPSMVLLAKLTESFGRRALYALFPGAEWAHYSWFHTYLSALLGGFLHLGWDITLHHDVNVGFPFVDILNPCINSLAYSLVFPISLIMIPIAYIIGKRINQGSPFKKLP
jgi:hypothetical protein